QVVVNAINSLLGSYGEVIDLDNPVNLRQGDDKAFNQFIDDVKAGKVKAAFFYKANPVYDHPRGAELAEALSKIELSVSFADRADETASLLKYITPAPHFLRSEEHTSELQSREISYAVFCLKNKMNIIEDAH